MMFLFKKKKLGLNSSQCQKHKKQTFISKELHPLLLAPNDTAKALDSKAESNHTTDYLSYGTNCFHFKAD